MSSDPLLAIAKLLLSKVLIQYFDLTNHKAQAEEIHFYFKEDNSTPAEFKIKNLRLMGSLLKPLFKISLFAENRCF
ncbi:MAG: hypothetical protein ACJAQX_000669 [Polaribacter sp.]|jgi:hypothetical protein